MNRCLFIGGLWNASACGHIWDMLAKCLVNMKRRMILSSKVGGHAPTRVLQWTSAHHPHSSSLKTANLPLLSHFTYAKLLWWEKAVVSQLQEDLMRQITSHPTTHTAWWCVLTCFTEHRKLIRVGLCSIWVVMYLKSLHLCFSSFYFHGSGNSFLTLLKINVLYGSLKNF